MENKKGLFISFEGGEGSGKSTIISMVREALEREGYNTVLTREPGGDDNVCSQIREVLLKNGNSMDPLTEAYLFAADRAEHVKKVIQPALAEGEIVLSDRYLDSNLAYQGYARKLGMDVVNRINKIAVDGCMPDLTIYLDVEPQIGLARVASRSKGADRLDKESVSFHQLVRQGYLKLCKQYSDRIFDVECSTKDIGEVFREVKSIIDGVLQREGIVIENKECGITTVADSKTAFVYVEDQSRGEVRLIGEVSSVKEVWQKIREEYSSWNNFHSYYSRINDFPDYWWIDVGSHNYFFRVTKGINLMQDINVRKDQTNESTN